MAHFSQKSGDSVDSKETFHNDRTQKTASDKVGSVRSNAQKEKGASQKIKEAKKGKSKKKERSRKPVSIQVTKAKKNERKEDQSRREEATKKIRATAKKTLSNFSKDSKPSSKPKEPLPGTRVINPRKKKSEFLGTRMGQKASLAQNEADAKAEGGEFVPLGETPLQEMGRNFKRMAKDADPRELKKRRAEFKAQSKMDPDTADNLEREIQKAGPSVVKSEEPADNPKKGKAKALIKKIAQASGFFPKDGESTREFISRAVSGFGAGFEKGFQVGAAGADAGSSILSGIAAIGTGAAASIDKSKAQALASRELDIKEKEATRKAKATAAKENLDANKLFVIAQPGEEGAIPFDKAGLPESVQTRFSKEGGGTGFVKTRPNEMAELRKILIESDAKHRAASLALQSDTLDERKRAALITERDRAEENARKARKDLADAQQHAKDLEFKINKNQADRLESERTFKLESSKLEEAIRKNKESAKTQEEKDKFDRQLRLRMQMSLEDNNSRLGVNPRINSNALAIQKLVNNGDPVPDSLLREKASLSNELAQVSRTAPVRVFQPKSGQWVFAGMNVPFTGEKRQEYEINRPEDLPNHSILGQIDAERALRLGKLSKAMQKFGGSAPPEIWKEYKDHLLYFAGQKKGKE